jgi:3'-phosphoadenosine 5'-phosphosulfate sulfotransferase (PAPS reductase)/FAD synthetase
MLDYVYTLALEQGVAQRIHAVHCDLGRMEWQGARELAQRQCDRYGVPLDIVSRPQGDILHQAEFERKMWPDSTRRWCTSDQKRGQVDKVITKLVNAWLARHACSQVRVLNCLGLRAQESSSRKKNAPFVAAGRGTNGKRTVDHWLPIHEWTEERVWQHIRAHGLEYHHAYDLGMPRLSCVFCIFAPREALLLAGYHNRALLAEYVGVERRIQHAFQHKKPLVQIQATLEGGYVPARVDPTVWKQCA